MYHRPREVIIKPLKGGEKERTSPGKRYKPEQIVTILCEIDVKTVNGITIPEACKQAEISEQTYYRWRKIYGGLKVDQARRLKEVEAENSRLEKLVTHLSLREAMLKEVVRGTTKPCQAQSGGFDADGALPRL